MLFIERRRKRGVFFWFFSFAFFCVVSNNTGSIVRSIPRFIHIRVCCFRHWNIRRVYRRAFDRARCLIRTSFCFATRVFAVATFQLRFTFLNLNVLKLKNCYKVPFYRSQLPIVLKPTQTSISFWIEFLRVVVLCADEEKKHKDFSEEPRICHIWFKFISKENPLVKHSESIGDNMSKREAASGGRKKD